MVFLLLLILLAPGPPAFGQYQMNKDDPRMQRARRESTVFYTGQVARKIVEDFGDSACYALMSCSQRTGHRLSEWHNSGEFERQIPRPKDLLTVIGQPGAGESVAIFALEHAHELNDPDTCDAYLLSPLQYTCAIKRLSDGAAEMRVKRLQMEAARMPLVPTVQQPVMQPMVQRPAVQPIAVQPMQPPQQWQPSAPQVESNVLVILGGVALIGAFIWYRRRQQEVYGAA
jgi:hypothetical protein